MKGLQIRDAVAASCGFIVQSVHPCNELCSAVADDAHPRAAREAEPQQETTPTTGHRPDDSQTSLMIVTTALASSCKHDYSCHHAH
jgi:hypothetical protein